MGIDKFPVTNIHLFVKRDISHHFIGKDKPSTVDAKGHKPVTYVSFDDAQAFCEWEVKDCLPKEWEYAAGGNVVSILGKSIFCEKGQHSRSGYWSSRNW